MLDREIIAVCSQIHIKHKYTEWAEKQLLGVQEWIQTTKQSRMRPYKVYATSSFNVWHIINYEAYLVTGAKNFVNKENTLLFEIKSSQLHIQCEHKDKSFSNFNGKLLKANPLKNTTREFLRIYINYTD